MDEKQDWVIHYDRAKSVSVVTQKSIYPINLILQDHDFIEQMEIPNRDYINIKIYGRWAKLYLPSEQSFELDDSLK